MNPRPRATLDPSPILRRDRIPRTALLLVALGQGCAAEDEAFFEEVYTNPAFDGAIVPPDEDEFRLGAAPSLYWAGNPVMIPVCWETDTPDATARAWVREAIESSWARVARVNFIGWGWCTPGAPGVHLRNLEQAIAAGELPPDADPNANGYGTTQIGRFLDGFDDGVTLSFCNGAGTNRQNCVKGIAMHEFGHVLGFHHSEERLDYDGPMCGNPVDASGNPLYPAPVSYGEYDIDSIMSYCGGIGPRLSAGDIAGVQRAYGRRSAGTLMSPRSKCLSNNQFNPGNLGQGSFLWDCWEDYDNQQWRYRPVNGELRIRPGFPGALEACMDQWGHGDQTRASDCAGTFAQRFEFEDIEIRGFGGKCLTLMGGTSNGTEIAAWECYSDRLFPSYNDEQRWNIVHQANGRIEIRFATDPDKCLTVQNASTNNGTPLVLWDCGTPQAQAFRLSNDGTIRFDKGGVTKCLDVVGPLDADFVAGEGGPWDGAPLQLFSCLSSQLNQKFNFTGQIRNLVNPSECLDRQWNGDANGVITWGWTCTENTPLRWNHAQVWDYYFQL